MKDVAIVSYCRTGIGKAQRGALNMTHGIPMTAHVLRHAVERAAIEGGEVEDVVVGCGLPEGATGHNIGRNAALEAGFGNHVPGMTITRYCGSGITAVSIVASRIAAGEMTTAIAAGVESISLVQFNLNLNGFFYPPLQQRMPSVWWTMNQTADHVAQKYGISREAQDAYVVESQRRVAAAKAAGKYAEEIVPFTTTMKVTDKATKATHEEQVTIDHDEGPRPDTTLEGLAKLKPVYPGGTTTAGNASQLSDGAAAVVMMDADLAAKRGLPILGLFRGMQLAAVAPEEMSIAITPAIRKLIARHALAAGDIDLWELHEAYAVTTLYNQAQLETPWEITNVNGAQLRSAIRTACRESDMSGARSSSSAAEANIGPWWRCAPLVAWPPRPISSARNGGPSLDDMLGHEPRCDQTSRTAFGSIRYAAVGQDGSRTRNTVGSLHASGRTCVTQG